MTKTIEIETRTLLDRLTALGWPARQLPPFVVFPLPERLPADAVVTAPTAFVGKPEPIGDCPRPGDSDLALTKLAKHVGGLCLNLQDQIDLLDKRTKANHKDLADIKHHCWGAVLAGHEEKLGYLTGRLNILTERVDDHIASYHCPPFVSPLAGFGCLGLAGRSFVHADPETHVGGDCPKCGGSSTQGCACQ